MSGIQTKLVKIIIYRFLNKITLFNLFIFKSFRYCSRNASQVSNVGQCLQKSIYDDINYLVRAKIQYGCLWKFSYSVQLVFAYKLSVRSSWQVLQIADNWSPMSTLTHMTEANNEQCHMWQWTTSVSRTVCVIC